MNTTSATPRNWFGFIPKGGPGLIGFIVVVALAFSFGLLLSGGDDTGAPVTSNTAEISQATQSQPTLWTCAMHPQIKLPHPGKCPICFMDLIPVETSGEELGPRQLRMTETAKQLARIETTPVIRSFAEAEIRMFGKIDYDETKLAYITAWVPGRLDRLYADFTGITVKKGDHMVYMYSPELLATQEELIQAKEAAVKLRESSSLLQATAQTTLEAARDKLRLYGLTAQQISEIENTGKSSDHLTIYAPIGGVVVQKEALEGMYVKTGTKIYTIADLSKLWVVFDAYESDLPWLRYGQKVEFTSLSFPGEKFTALISFIDPVLNKKTRTVKVRAVVNNKHGKLKPEMFVSGIVKSRLNAEGEVVDEELAGQWICPMHPEIVKDGPGTCDICGMPLVPAESLGYAAQISTEQAPLLIPAFAPLITGTRAVVYVQVTSDTMETVFEGREVVLGPRAGDYYVVKSGLAEGEPVVTNGAFKIDSELQIRAKPSMMNPEGGQAPPVHQPGQEPPAPAQQEKPSHEKRKEPQPITVSPEALSALTPIYESYFKLQMALASDDPVDAAKACRELTEAVKSVKMSLFSGSAHERWMDLSEKIAKQADKGAESSDLIAARESFLLLSQTMINLHETFGHAGEKNYYLTFCPMADDNKGAYWLQTVDTVYNSFYGAAMLRCGEIKGALPATAGPQK
jgi:Cu(I)/Ag(I) efflux system membrane fusion protein